MRRELTRLHVTLRVEAINYEDPDKLSEKVGFDDLTAMHPSGRIILEHGADEINMRVVDMVTPIGKGTRGLIVAPPRTGKTVLMQNIALALGIKAVFLALTVTGQATMWMAVFADMGGSLLVVANGLRLLRR